MTNVPAEFIRFISQDCNRMDFIISYLAVRGIKAVVMPVEGRNHIYTVFPQSSYNPMFRIKTVIAHYDRVTGSPGANDNSAAVFSMMEWASRLAAFRGVHNIRLIFTDGEELCSAGIASQGAFSLAGLFRKLSITNDDVFVFDCMGRGSVPVLARECVPSGASAEFKKQFAALEQRTKTLLQSAAGGHWVTLPVSYSDNAGFLACGIPAVAITMLPDDEASKYMFDLVKNPGLADFVMRKKNGTDGFLKEKVPLTWRLIHSPGDSAESLTPESFSVTAEILDRLADMKSMA